MYCNLVAEKYNLHSCLGWRGLQPQCLLHAPDAYEKAITTLAFEKANGSDKEQARSETKRPAIFASGGTPTVPMATVIGTITPRLT